MKEIFTIADTVTVMRDGKKVGDYNIDEVKNKIGKINGRTNLEAYITEKREEQRVRQYWKFKI